MGQDFTINDFRKHFDSIEKMGMTDMVSRMPGMAEMVPKGEDPEVALQRVRRMIDAMTDAEREDTGRIDAAARQRIAAAAGTEPRDVEQFLKQFAQVRELMLQMMNMSVWERIQMVLGFKRFRPPPRR